MLNRNLAVFIAAAEAKSVTKAAEKLHITQPAVSNAIAKLEEIFDVRLFFRDRRKESFLTPAGEEILRLALQMRRLVDQKRKSSVSQGRFASPPSRLWSLPS